MRLNKLFKINISFRHFLEILIELYQLDNLQLSR